MSKPPLGGGARYSFKRGVSPVKEGQDDVCSCLLTFLHDVFCCLDGIFNLAIVLGINSQVNL